MKPGHFLDSRALWACRVEKSGSECTWLAVLLLPSARRRDRDGGRQSLLQLLPGRQSTGIDRKAFTR